jgi:hypothetical protein
MTRVKSALTATSGEREANAAEWRRLVDERNPRRGAAAESGSSKAGERRVARGRLLALYAGVEPARFGVFRM